MWTGGTGPALPRSLVPFWQARALLTLTLALYFLHQHALAGHEAVRAVTIVLLFESVIGLAALGREPAAFGAFRPWMVGVSGVTLPLALVLLAFPELPLALDTHPFTAVSLLAFVNGLLSLLVFASLVGRSSWALFAWSCSLNIMAVTLHLARAGADSGLPEVATTLLGATLLLTGPTYFWALPWPRWQTKNRNVVP